MVKVIPIYIIIILLIAVLVFKCDTPKPSVIYKTIHTSDTIIDTLRVSHTNLEVDTIIKLDTLVKIEFQKHGYALHEYHYKIKVSLLDGTIIAKSPFKPDIEFNYNLKSVTIKDSIHTKEQVLKGFYYGGELMVMPLLSQMFIGVAYQDNRGQIFDIAVGRDFQNESNLIKLGYKKRF